MSLKYRMTPEGMSSMYTLAWSNAAASPSAEPYAVEMEAAEELAEVKAAEAEEELVVRLPVRDLAAAPAAQQSPEDEGERLLREPLEFSAAVGMAQEIESLSERMWRMEQERPLKLLRLGYVF